MKNYFTEEEIKELYKEQEVFESTCNDSEYSEEAKIVYIPSLEDDCEAILTEEEVKAILEALDDDIPF